MCKPIVPHKWADVMHAWADGATIQWKDEYKEDWKDIKCPAFMDNIQYRVKPTPITKEQAREALHQMLKKRPFSQEYGIIWDFLNQDD